MEKSNEKANRYTELIRESDFLDHQISKLRATNGGINLSEEIEKEIYQLQLRKEKIGQELMKLYN